MGDGEKKEGGGGGGQKQDFLRRGGPRLEQRCIPFQHPGEGHALTEKKGGGG